MGVGYRGIIRAGLVPKSKVDRIDGDMDDVGILGYSRTLYRNQLDTVGVPP